MSDTQTTSVLLPHRGVLTVAGADRAAFLQGLLTNDMTRVGPGRAVWAGLLTPQGKVLHDLFVSERDEVIHLEGEAERLDDLRSRLGKYKLRAKVTLEIAADLAVAAVFGAAKTAFDLPAEAGAARPLGTRGLVLVDPRLAQAGLRVVLPAAEMAATLREAGCLPGDLGAYDAHRLRLGLPDGSRDMGIEQALPMESGFEDLAGVDFRKGCYVGQEVTTRMKHRKLVRKRLMPVLVEGPLPAPLTAVVDAEGREVGTLRSGDAAAGYALALLKLASLEHGPFTAGEATLTPILPDWMRLPESA
jgi:folate-binding protein YgfZ